MENHTTICMAKSVSGRPNILRILDFDSVAVGVSPIEGNHDRPLWLPRSVLYRYNKDLASKMMEAFERGDSDLLENLWLRSKPWSPEHWFAK